MLQTAAAIYLTVQVSDTTKLNKEQMLII